MKNVSYLGIRITSILVQFQEKIVYAVQKGVPDGKLLHDYETFVEELEGIIERWKDRV